MSSGIFIAVANLVRDAEVRHSASGTAICSFSIPVDTGWGENKKTQWIECVMFGKRAEGKLPEYLKKGQCVYIVGETSAEAWSDKATGEAKCKLKVVVDKIELVGKRLDPSHIKHETGNTSHHAAHQNQNQSQYLPDFDDDLPF